jgi:hypothetical protein
LRRPDLAVPPVGSTQAGNTIGLILGDNFYPWGITRRREQWRLDYEFSAKVMRVPSLRVPWYGTVGNHDGKPKYQYRDNVAIAKEEDINNRFWIMPGPRQTVPPITVPPMTPGGSDGFVVQVFFYSTEWGFENNNPHMPEEARWLDAALTASSADLKIVATHEPMHGFFNGRNLVMIEHFQPVLMKHRVPLVVTAHAHGIQLYRCPGGFYQLTVASYSDSLHTQVLRRRPRGYHYLGRGAALIGVNVSHLTVATVDLEGRHVFAHSFDWRLVQRQMAALAGGNRQQEQELEKEIGPTALW